MTPRLAIVTFVLTTIATILATTAPATARTAAPAAPAAPQATSAGPDATATPPAATSAAQDAPSATPAPAPPPPPRLAFRLDTQWIAAVAPVHPSNTWLNPGNLVLRIPQTTWLGEVRFDARVERGSRWQVVVRPRVRAFLETTRIESMPPAHYRDARIEFTEAYLIWRPADAVSITYGLQNFQWGPAELMGPSNRIFHETGVFRDVLYLVRGKHLARVNISAGRQWSLVALAEVGATNEAPFRAGAPFRRAGQAKLEYTTSSGAAYAGVTAGARGGEPPWVGGYGAVTMINGLSAYADVSMQRGSQAWYPVSTSAGSVTLATDERSSGAHALALAGLRYSFSWSAAFDARIEYLRQDAGYTRAEVQAAPYAVAQDPVPDTVDRWLRPGLEFLGRDLILVSILARDVAPAKRLDLQGRYLRSLTDGSGAGFVTASLDASDRLLVFGSLTLTHGAELTEFTRLARAGGVAGFIWSW